MNTLEFQHVEKSFNRKKILDDVCLKLENGVYGLLGENGAGKTSLFRCITNYYKYQGKILLNGEKMKGKRLREIGYLPQSFVGFPELTVEEMLDYFAVLKKIGKKERREQVEHCLISTHLNDIRHKKIKTLSGGMVRRLGVAQAILGDPGILILDEPASGLDPEERNRLNKVLIELAGDRIVMMSTHIVEDVEACCDHLLVMQDGRIVFQGIPTDIREYAAGRILEIPQDQLSSEEGSSIIKVYYREDRKMVRVMTEEPVEEAVEPTVEDGYLCLCQKK